MNNTPLTEFEEVYNESFLIFPHVVGYFGQSFPYIVRADFDYAEYVDGTVRLLVNSLTATDEAGRVTNVISVLNSERHNFIMEGIIGNRKWWGDLDQWW